MNKNQNVNTYALDSLSTGDHAWNYAVTNLWRGYGLIWNIESYDHHTQQYTLPWYQGFDVLHYFADYAYQVNSGNKPDFIFDENNALNQHFYGVPPGELYNASAANNRRADGTYNGNVTPQAIW